MLLGLTLDDDALDAGLVEQHSQQRSGRSGADDRHLSSDHLFSYCHDGQYDKLSG